MNGKHLLTGTVALTAALAATSAAARLKDSVEFYVQDGLQLNYDGIRNAGVGAAHDENASTWVNLGSLGAGYNLARLRADDVSEGWQADGYRFWHQNSFWVKKNLTIPTNYTVQVLVDARTSDQAKGNMGYIFFPTGNRPDGKTNWQHLSLVVREDTCNSGKRARLNNNNSTGAGAPDLDGSYFNYLTAQLNGTEKWSALFSDTTAPKSGGNYKATPSPNETTFASAWGLGGNPNTSAKTTGQGLYGTIKSFRFYNRVLTQAELEWNRRIDEARFFGDAATQIPLPVTNAVVASSPSFLAGTEANGAYAVDGEGHTFTAPTAKTDRGIDYALTGYTLETWDAETGAWGEPFAHDGEAACAVTESAKVRITWKWRAVAGLVTPALATAYGVEDYVQDGLILNYDGIRNVGANAPHDANALVWNNVAPAGGHHLERYCYPTDKTNESVEPVRGTYPDGSEWQDDGFLFSGRGSHFFCAEKVTLPPKYTMQALVDAKPADQVVNTITYVMSTSPWNYSTIGIRNQSSDDTKLYMAAEQMLSGKDSPGIRPSLGMKAHYDYATGVLDTFEVGGETVSGLTFFDGTAIPSRSTISSTGGWSTGNVVQAHATTLQVGGFHGTFNLSGAQLFAGKLKSLRLYDRVLTEAELELNRRIDDARFFGALAETNVVVETSHSFLPGAEPAGVYGVLAGHTFTAPATATDRGVDYALVGYTLEAWDDAAGAWGAAEAHEGASYAYAAGSSPAKVRLTWQWKATRGLRTAADYDVQDYAPVGLVINYDGIRNVGAASPHDVKSRGWCNAAPNGGHDLVFESGAVAWAGDSFDFNGKTVFRLDDLHYLPPRYTFQTLVDAKTTDQGGIGYIIFPPQVGSDNGYWQKFSIGIRSSAYNDLTDTYYIVADTALGGRADIHEVQCSYATAIMDKTYALMFPGVDQTDTPGRQRRNGGSKSNPGYDFPGIFRVGGAAANNQCLKGRLKSLRYYDRVLTNEELARNRNVDNARYYGELATTNVFVKAARFGNGQAETGAYKVEGSWTFTAGAATDEQGEKCALVGYAVETLKDGVWTDKTLHAGSAYTYEEGKSPATVRLTWRWNVGMTILVR